MYRLLMRLVLRRVDAEAAHRAGMTLLRIVGAVAPLRMLVRRACAVPGVATTVFDRPAPSPLGVAAGLDKNARAVLGLAALGFGVVEIGTVTARPQPGNPRLRLVRLPDDRAIVNRMGFNNDGAAVVAERLRRLRRSRAGRAVVLGVNVGRSKSARSDETVDDYRTSVRLLGPYADYLVVNISSPNTPGLRDLHEPDRLRPLLAAVVDEAPAGLPVLLKVSPDLADGDLLAVADVVTAAGLAGLVTTNTTVSRRGLRTGAAEVERAGDGGLSGPPLAGRAEQVQTLLRGRLGPAALLVASGGVDTAADVIRRRASGAVLVQAYTGFVYGGPGWPRAVNRALAARAQGR